MQMYQVCPQDSEGKAWVNEGEGSNWNLCQVGGANETHDIKEIQVWSQPETIDTAEVAVKTKSRFLFKL
jgi:hypothetical protein